MESTLEFYFTKKYISKEEWLSLIKVISDYNGLLKKWKIIIQNDKNKIRYFIKSKYKLPPTINHLNSFLLKSGIEICLPKTNITLLFITKIGSNIIDIINYSEIKNKGNLVFIEITFQKLYDEKIRSKTKFYFHHDGLIKRYRAIFSIPSSILSVNFDSNKRYFYQSAPKYLEINKVLPLLSMDSNSSILKIDTFPYLQGDFYFSQNDYSFDKHSIILGSSGSGKSKFICLLISNIYKNKNLKQKYKIIVIDPHAALEDDIGGIAKVIDFKSTRDSIDLFINSHHDVISSTELLLELLKSLISDQYNAKLERVLRHSIHLLLTDESFNFSNLRKLLLDLEYRNSLIKKLKFDLPISVIEFFLSDFNDLKTKSYGEAISPIVTFIDEMEMIPVFNEQEDKKNLKNTISDNFLTLFSLDRTKLGDKVTKTISGLIMQQLLIIIQRREMNEHIIFVVDEFAIIENPILARFLSEARKYNLSLILAGQYFNQISENLKNSIFANIINYYIFRVSKLDANLLVDSFDMKIPLDDNRDRKVKLLNELNNRECIVRIDSNGKLLPAFKAETLNYSSIPRIKESYHYEKVSRMQQKRKKNKFEIGNDVNLREILISNSSSRKVVK